MPSQHYNRSYSGHYAGYVYSGTCNNIVTCVSNGLSWYIRVTFLILARKILMALIFLLWYGAEKEKVPSIASEILVGYCNPL